MNEITKLLREARLKVNEAAKVVDARGYSSRQLKALASGIKAVEDAYNDEELRQL